MAIALVNSVGYIPAGADGGTSGAIDTTGATLLVAAVTYWVEPSRSDSKGNTWVAVTASEYGYDPKVRFYYVKNPTVGSGHTFTLGGSGSYSLLGFAAFSGTDTSANVDQQNGATGTQPGSITPTADNELIVCMIGSYAASRTIDSGFTEICDLAGGGGPGYGMCLAYKVQTTATAVNPTWSENNATAIASFKAGGGGAAFIARPNLRQIQAVNRASRW